MCSITAQTAPPPDGVATLLARGEQALQSGDLAVAAATFQRVIALAPTAADGYFGLGLTALRAGRPDQAITNLRTAVERNEQMPGAHLFLGIAEYQNGEVSKALSDLRTERTRAPRNEQALLWLGIVALGTDHPDQATEPLDQAVALQPGDAEAIYYQARAHALVAESALRRLYALDPDSALVHRATAETLASSGQPEKAAEEYQLALKKDPNNPDLLEGLGDTEQKLAHFDIAVGAYTHELTLNPGSPVALYNLGKIDVEHGRPSEGVALLRQAVQRHAPAGPTAFYLGYGLAQKGENTEAAKWLETALASDPSSFIQESALFQIARVYQRLGRKQEAEQAVARLQQAKAKDSPAGSTAQPASTGTGANPQP